MKTKKSTISMKTMAIMIVAMTFTALLNAQFEIPNPNTPGSQTAEEVRATSSVDYDITADWVAGEQIRWAVRGGTITAGGVVTTSGDTSIVEFTVDATTITVNWDTDITATPIGSAAGEIFVQKRTGSGCPSQLQELDITMWNNASADLTDADISICSGTSLGGTLTIDLTGAPDPVADGFVVTYNVVATGLTDLGANALDATGSTVTSNGPTVTIALPDGLVNTTGANATYTVTLTAMYDDFSGNGTLVDSEYVVTVNPVPVTGDINSSSSLTRR
jgi:hypothetical protein